MTDFVFVTQEAPTGRWVAACCDDRCGFGMHTLADTTRKSRAEAAATRHRRYLAALSAPPGKQPEPDECERCGQPARAVEELRELVAELETRLARYEKETA